MKKGFTLLEILVVIIILGILASLGYSQYQKTVEKGRTAEAKRILGHIRTLQQAYRVKHGRYTNSTNNLGLLSTDVPFDCNQTTHYFRYNLGGGGNAAWATRCTTAGAEAGGKRPGAAASYNMGMNYDTGNMSGSMAGYY